MIKQILNALTAKFPGVDAQILSRIATNLAKTITTEAEVPTAVEGITTQSIIESQSDFRANEATANAVANYEKKYSLKDGKKDTAVDPDPEPIIAPGSDDAPAWAQTLINSHRTLSDKVEAIEGAKVTDTRKQRFNAIISNLPDNLKKSYQRTSISTLTEEEFESLSTEVMAEVGVIEADIKAKGSVFQLPLGGGGSTIGKPSEKDANAVAKVLGL